ncbi:glycosyl transferase [Candidatus Altiarchaeales archaeon WOR_SM1_SCG]|nr:glycosyl transferase [Candidatus Altiarchaeales archaeon WOR_SM1_SCG]
MAKTEVSIVIPVLNEEKNIPILYLELKKVMDALDKNYEIIFIDDGSTDKTFNILKELREKDKKVKIIKFRKNFGQTSAIQAGFDHAKGDVLIITDGDLQNDPADIPKLLEKLDEGFDVVSGWRADRKDPFFTKKIPSKISNWLASALTCVKIHDFGCTLKAYTRDSLEDVRIYGEMHRYIPALVAWSGFSVTEIKVNHRPRKYGKTKYGIKRLLKGFLDLINLKFWMEYSTRPLHLFGFLGLCLFFMGFITGLYLTIMRLFYGVSLSNRPLLLLAVLLVVLGMQFIIFGFLGELIVRVYYDEKDRKIYKIKEIIE